MSLGKVLQRRLFSLLNSPWGLLVFIALTYLLLARLVDVFIGADPCRLRGGSSMHCSTMDFADNIGGVRSEEYRAFGPIDVVYTWVNGSDPVWKKKKNFWADQYAPLDPVDQSSNTSFASNSSSANSTSHAGDEIMSDNRYRDSEELRYSLRSLVKYAPWIRHIYLVTDNQVPRWLDLESGRLTVVPHSAIFKNQSHLPVFSSPAIEANLHNIPGLSEYFIYFNDDVFLGSPTLPEDFISIAGTYKFVMAWEVPKCAPGCSDSWIGDGYCDKACNVSECNFDFPDCINGSNVLNPSGGGSSYSSTTIPLTQCATGCPDSWLADKICDQRCNAYECGFDMGDCGIQLVRDQFPELVLDSANTLMGTDVSPPPMRDTEESMYRDPDGVHFYYGDSREEGSPAAGDQSLSVAYGTRLVQINISHLFTHFISELQANSSRNASELLSVVKNPSASHSDDSNFVVQYAALLSKHQTLLVLLHNDDEHYSRLVREGFGPHYLWPMEVTFTVTLSDGAANSVTASFSVFVHDRDAKDYSTVTVPSGMQMLNSTRAVAARTAANQPLAVELLPIPYRVDAMRSDSQDDVDEQAIMALVEGLNSIEFDEREGSELRLRDNAVQSVAPAPRNGSAMIDLASAEGGVLLAIDAEAAVRLMGHASCEDAFLVIQASQANSPILHRALPLCRSLVEFARDRFDFVHNAPVQRVGAATNLTDALLASRQGYQRFVMSNAALQILRRQNIFTKRKSIDKASRVLVGIPLPSGLSAGPVTVLVKLGVANSSFAATMGQGFALNATIGVHEAAFVSILVPWGNNSVGYVDGPGTASIANATHPASGAQVVVELAASAIASATPEPVVPEPAANFTESSSAQLGLVELQPGDIDTPTISYINPIERRVSDATSRRLLEAAEPRSFLQIAVDAASDLASRARTLIGAVRHGPPARRRQGRDQGQGYYTDRLFNAFHLVPPAREQEGHAPSYAQRHSQGDHDHSGSHHHSHSRTPAGYGPDMPAPRGRRRLDTYAQSLIHVNRMYNKDFGAENRKVPAHVPHFLNKRYLDEMQSLYREEWDLTSSNRFRSAKDMQYAFSYYYYVINRFKKVKYDMQHYLATFVDSDGDGRLSDNEMRTLASIYTQHSPSDAEVADLHSALAACSANDTLGGGVLEEEHSFSSSLGHVRKTVSLQLHPRLALVLACPTVAEVLYKNIQWTNVYNEPALLSDKSLVAFEMIGDNTTTTMQQLDSIRSRQSKFVCVNDNMQHPDADLINKLRAFYLSFFPHPSRFELPEGQYNPTLYLDEYLELRRRRTEQGRALDAAAYLSQVERAAVDAVARAKAWVREALYALILLVSDVQPPQDPETRFVHRLRMDLRHQPEAATGVPRADAASLLDISFNYNHPREAASTTGGQASLHMGTLCLAAGVVLALLLRAALRGEQTPAPVVALPPAASPPGPAGAAPPEGRATAAKSKKTK